MLSLIVAYEIFCLIVVAICLAEDLSEILELSVKDHPIFKSVKAKR